MVQKCIRDPADRCTAAFHARPTCGMYKPRAGPCHQNANEKCRSKNDNLRLGENWREWMARDGHKAHHGRYWISPLPLIKFLSLFSNPNIPFAIAERRFQLRVTSIVLVLALSSVINTVCEHIFRVFLFSAVLTVNQTTVHHSTDVFGAAWDGKLRKPEASFPWSGIRILGNSVGLRGPPSM